jgi:hypothetical protein
MLERLILPELGDAKVVTLTPAQVRTWHTALGTERLTRNGTPTRSCMPSAPRPYKMKCSTPTRAVFEPRCSPSAAERSTF